MCAFSVFKPVLFLLSPFQFPARSVLLFCSFSFHFDPRLPVLPHLRPFLPVILLFYSCLMLDASLARSLHDLCLFSACYCTRVLPILCPFSALSPPVLCPFSASSLPSPSVYFLCFVNSLVVIFWRRKIFLGHASLFWQRNRITIKQGSKKRCTN